MPDMPILCPCCAGQSGETQQGLAVAAEEAGMGLDFTVVITCVLCSKKITVTCMAVPTWFVKEKVS